MSILLGFVIGLVIGAALATWYGINQHFTSTVRLWQQIETLQSDNRALTESVLRSQGKPYISSLPRERMPSEGWFDGAPRVKGHEN